MSTEKKEYEVNHPRFCMMVEGKMVRVPKGAKVKLTEAAAKKAGKRLVCSEEKPAVEVGGKKKAAAK